MEEKLRTVLSEGLVVFRGTNTYNFDQRRKDGFYFGSRREHDKKYITSTSTDLLEAMINGVHRCENDGYSSSEGAKPLLLVINAEPYGWSRALEPTEIEIEGVINFKDVVVVDSLDTLLALSPSEEEVRYFKEEYIADPTPK